MKRFNSDALLLERRSERATQQTTGLTCIPTAMVAPHEF
jgi:hypothetical protein